jgi:hypothetical protein
MMMAMGKVPDENLDCPNARHAYASRMRMQTARLGKFIKRRIPVKSKFAIIFKQLSFISRENH